MLVAVHKRSERIGRVIRRMFGHCSRNAFSGAFKPEVREHDTEGITDVVPEVLVVLFANQQNDIVRLNTVGWLSQHSTQCNSNQ